jgi:hypothetical protein
MFGMELKTYLKGLDGDDAREKFAIRCETTIGHMKNVMYGFKTCGTDLAVSIERESCGAVTRRELRPDWARHWPELVAGAHAQASNKPPRSSDKPSNFRKER